MSENKLFELKSIDDLKKELLKKYEDDEEFQKEREKIYYKAFRVGDLFERRGDHKIEGAIKRLDMSETKDAVYTIANVTATAYNNGIAGYFKDTGDVTKKKKSGYLTMAMNAAYSGVVFYHDYAFVTTGDNNYLKIKNPKFESDMSKHPAAYQFLAKLLTKIYVNKFHGFLRKPANDFDREIILLPVYQNDDGIEIISVKTLAYLYDQVRFNEYKKKIEELERERSSIKESLELYQKDLNFKNEHHNVYYRAFRVGDLFKRVGNTAVSTPRKSLNIIDEPNSTHNTPLISASIYNNGICGYLTNTGNVSHRGLSMATAGAGSGTVYFQDKDFYYTNNACALIPCGELTKVQISDDGFRFLSKILTRIFATKLHGFSRLITTASDFDREIIFLPVYDENNNEVISIDKMSDLYHNSVINSKETEIAERERAINETIDQLKNFAHESQ